MCVLRNSGRFNGNCYASTTPNTRSAARRGCCSEDGGHAGRHGGDAAQGVQVLAEAERRESLKCEGVEETERAKLNEAYQNASLILSL